MLQIILGSIMAMIGLFFVVASAIAIRTEKIIVPYNIFVAKSKGLWKERVHYFYLVSGLLIIIAGIVFACSVLWI